MLWTEFRTVGRQESLRRLVQTCGTVLCNDTLHRLGRSDGWITEEQALLPRSETILPTACLLKMIGYGIVPCERQFAQCLAKRMRMIARKERTTRVLMESTMSARAHHLVFLSYGVEVLSLPWLSSIKKRTAVNSVA